MIEIVPSVATQAASAVQTAGTLNIPSWVGGLVLAVLVGSSCLWWYKKNCTSY